MRRYFVCQDEKSNKFWQIEIEDKSFTVTYGKIGTDGQSKAKKFSTEEECKKEAEKLIKEKINKGYKENQITSQKKKNSVDSFRKQLEKYYKRTFSENVRKFYDENVIDQYQNKYFLLEYAGRKKVKVDFKDDYLINLNDWMEDFGYGEDIDWPNEDHEPLYQEMIAFALLSTDDENNEIVEKYLLAVNNKDEKSPVYIWAEGSFILLFDSLDQFLKSLRNKNEKDPIEILEELYNKGYQLYEQNKYNESNSILISAIEPFVEIKNPNGKLKEVLSYAFNTIGNNYYCMDDIKNAEENYKKSFLLGEYVGGGNLIRVYFYKYKDYKKTIDQCEKSYNGAYGGSEGLKFLNRYRMLSYIEQYRNLCHLIIPDKEAAEKLYKELFNWCDNKKVFKKIMDKISESVKSLLIQNENITSSTKKIIEELDEHINKATEFV